VIEWPDLAVPFAEINDLMGLGTIREMEQWSWRRRSRGEAMAPGRRWIEMKVKTR
jgi:hypothetical protein